MNKLIIITGASGAGKTTIAEIITPALSLNRAITAATRAIRPGEVDGVNYYFMDENRFRSMIESDELVEWEEVYPGDFRGLPKFSLNESLQKGNTISVLDINGAYKFVMQNIVSVPYLVVGIWEERDILVERLIGRGADGNIDDRIQKLDEEMKEVFELRNYPNTILIQNRTGKQDEVAKEVISKIKEFINS
jgi:guanylate kinase